MHVLVIRLKFEHLHAKPLIDRRCVAALEGPQLTETKQLFLSAIRGPLDLFDLKPELTSEHGLPSVTDCSASGGEAEREAGNGLESRDSSLSVASDGSVTISSRIGLFDNKLNQDRSHPFMARAIPPPAPNDLLPPLLACLPTAFASTRPPPALLTLLSPILRQRVQLLSDSSSSPSHSWLSKLSWDPVKAEQLGTIVEEGRFELHPVSNEIEFGDADIEGYRRLDEETLHSRVNIRDLDLTVIYLWCEGDEAGGGNGWRVAEVLPLGYNERTSSTWSKSMEAANDTCTQKPSATAKSNGVPPTTINGLQSDPAVDEGDDDNDDDYWAQYDNAPTSTPGPQPSPGPSPPKRHGRTTSDAEYFSRYSAVQPEMDNDDPSADRNAIGESSLNGNTLTSPINHVSDQLPAPIINKHLVSNNEISAPQPQLPSQPLTTDTISDPADQTRPRTATSSSRSSAIVDKLEGSAMLQSQTELAVRQHVASTMKSLWRLARGTGMEIGEFAGLVGREVECLEMEEGMETG
ncbi:MAG: hypothetical protein Q9218_005170 [Villophora microphyllina]